MLAALAVNDWLRTRYPEPAKLRETSEIPG
jgi:hypothetical protein